MPNILYLFWHPAPKQDFLQMGDFRLWIETADSAKTKKQNLHPRHFDSASLGKWLKPGEHTLCHYSLFLNVPPKNAILYDGKK